MGLVFLPTFGSFSWYINVAKCTSPMDPVGSVYFIPTKFGSLGGDQLVDIFSHGNLLHLKNGPVAKGMNFRLWKPALFFRCSPC